MKAGALSKDWGAEVLHMSAEVSFVRAQTFPEVVRWPGGFWPFLHIIEQCEISASANHEKELHYQSKEIQVLT